MARADRKRFLFISSCPMPWGGSEELWWRAACVLRQRGHEVDVLKTLVDDDQPRIRHLRELGCTVRDLEEGSRRAFHLAAAFLPNHFEAFDRREVIRAGRFMVGDRPDLVIVSQGQNLDGIRFARLSALMRVPYVLVAQKATWLTWPIDDFRPIVARTYLDARRAVFVSNHNRRLTEDQAGIRLDNAVVLRNPVLAGVDGPLPWPDVEAHELRLACVARLDIREKGHDLLIRALAHPRWRERPVTLDLYGNGHHQEGLRGLADSLGLDNVSFEGHVDDIEAVWRSHHALVLPSRAEGLPLSIVEAMMCGRPAIVTDVGGNAEVIDDGVTGFVASGPTVAAIDEALERAWEHRETLAATGKRAATRIRELVPGDPGAILADLLVASASPARANGPAWVPARTAPAGAP